MSLRLSFPRRGAPAKQATLLLFLLTVHVSADTLRSEVWNIECSAPAPHNFTITRGETLTIAPTFTDHNLPLTLSNATAVVLQYRDTSLASNLFYASTGSVVSASAGSVSIPWSPACEAAASLYTYTIAARATSGQNLSAFGTIRLLGSVGGTATNMPAVFSSIDWSAVQNLNVSSAPWPTSLTVTATATNVLFRDLIGAPDDNAALSNRFAAATNAVTTNLLAQIAAGDAANSNNTASATNTVTTNLLAQIAAGDAANSNNTSALATNLNANNLAAGTVPLARLSGITSNQIDAATDSAYRGSDGTSTSDVQAVVNNMNATGVVSVITNQVRSLESGVGALSNAVVVATNTINGATVYGGVSYSTRALYVNYTLVKNLSSSAFGGMEQAPIVVGSINEEGPSEYGGTYGSTVEYFLTWNPNAPVDGQSISNLNASELLLGTVPLARLSGITTNQMAATERDKIDGAITNGGPVIASINAGMLNLTNAVAQCPTNLAGGVSDPCHTVTNLGAYTVGTVWVTRANGEYQRIVPTNNITIAIDQSSFPATMVPGVYLGISNGAFTVSFDPTTISTNGASSYPRGSGGVTLTNAESVVLLERVYGSTNRVWGVLQME